MSNEFLKNANPNLKEELNMNIYANKFADYLLSIHLLATGTFTILILDYNNMNKSTSYLSIPSYFKEMITDDFDKDSQWALKKLLQISFGDTFLLEKSLASLGIKEQNHPLIEFCNLLLEKDINFHGISNRLGYKHRQSDTSLSDHHQDIKILKSIVSLMIAFQKFEIISTQPSISNILTERVNLSKDQLILDYMLASYRENYLR
jgi:hypothetical protein